MLIGAPEYSWVLLSTPEGSLVFEFLINSDKQKMLISKMTSMQYFGNILVKISPNNNKMDIFRIYTERVVENVQDRISKPLGGRDIIQNLRETFFWDTL